MLDGASLEGLQGFGASGRDDGVLSRQCQQGNTSAMERGRSRERERSTEPRASDFKVFVGGISWQTTDQELSDSECFGSP